MEKIAKRGKVLPYLLAGALSMGIMLCVYALLGVYPFGARSIVHVDMYAQYLDFHTLAWRVLREGISPLYSFSAGLGDGLIPLFAYYLMSPFTLLVVLFPVERIMDALLLITLLKYFAIGVAYMYFARRFLRAGGGTALPFAISYALCGFVIVYAGNIMWLDGLILLPVVLVQMKRLLESGRWLGLLAAFAALFWVQFYIGYMVGIFSLICFVLMAFCGKYARLPRKFFLFAAAALLAAGACAALLLPTALRLLGNAANTTVNAKAIEGFSLSLSQVLKQAGKLFPFTSDRIWSENAAVFSGLLSIILVPAYLFNRRFSKKERLSVALLLLFLCAGFFVPGLAYFWHAFDHASAFPFRFSFLFSFTLVAVANRYFMRIGGTRPIGVWISTAMALVFLVIVRPHAMYAKENVVAGLVAAACVLLLYAALIGVYCARPRRGLTVALLAVLCLEMGATAYTSLQGAAQDFFVDRQTLLEEVSTRKELLAAVEDAEDTAFRVDEYRMERRNISMALGNMRMQYFSSTALGELGDAYKRLGYQHDGIIHSYEGHTIATESLLGIRYVFGNPEQMLDQQPNDYYSLISQQGDLSLYENRYAFPLAFLVDEEALRFSILGDENDDLNPFEMQNAALAALSGSGETQVFLPLGAQMNAFDMELKQTSPGAYSASSIGANGYAYQKAEVPLDAPLYIDLEILDWNSAAFLSTDLADIGESFGYLGRKAEYLGQYFPGDTVWAVLHPVYGAFRFRSEDIYALDMEALEALSDAFYETQMTDLQWEAGRISGVSSVAQGGQALFLSVPYDGGWLAWIDGNPVEVQPALGVFLGINVPEGEHTVLLQYRHPGLRVGIVISCVSILLILLIATLQRRRKRAIVHSAIHP